MDWKTNSVVLAQLRDFEAHAAWDLLVTHFRAPIIGFARRLGLDEGEAQDVAQDTLIAFAEALRQDGYRAERGRLRSWLFGFARRHVLNARRRKAAEGELMDRSQAALAALSDPSSRDPSMVWDQEWERSVYERALSVVRTEVSAETYALFQRFALESVDADRLAAEFEVPRTRVYNAKHRVLRRIAELVRSMDDV